MTTPWIQTVSGKKFYPLAPREEDVDIRDIAHALSNICRFSGQCKQHHSVAIHCVNVSKLLEYIYGDEASELAMMGLLHDASEAYFGDIPSPVKNYIADFAVIEARLTNAILKSVLPKADLGSPMWSRVCVADAANLVTEARELFDTVCDNWTDTVLKEIPEHVRMPAHWLQLGLQPKEAERRFLLRYDDLKKRINP